MSDYDTVNSDLRRRAIELAAHHLVIIDPHSKNHFWCVGILEELTKKLEELEQRCYTRQT